jgi:hypothetical protein
MKAHTLLTLCTALAAGGAPAQNATGGRYSVGGAVLPNGGGHAAGGRYSVDATVDQPATESGQAGRFELAAGFWSPVTVQQVVDAPALAIELLPDGKVRLRWAATKAPFVLEGTADLAANQWQDFPTRPVSDGVELSVVILPAEPMRCFRLGRAK